VKAIRFHYRPARYLFTRWRTRRQPLAGIGRFGCIACDEIEPPTLPGPEWVRIESIASGICGSDLSAITAHDSFTLEPFGAFPFTFGHENVGRIAEAGTAAGAWRVGERVVINPMLPCVVRALEPCPPCRRGEYGLCRRTTDGAIGKGPIIGYSPRTGGGWSRFFVAHRSQLHGALDLPDEVAVLADPFVSALRPVLLHPPAEDDTVLVIGAGTIGILTIAALRAAGWAGGIAALSRHDFQATMAERAGATTLLRSRDELYRWAAGLPEAVAYKPSLAPRFVEGGPSLIYDSVGSQATVGDAMALTREGGRMVLIGGAARIAADWTRLWYRNISVAGVYAYGPATAPDGTRGDVFPIALDLLRASNIGELGMVTHQFPIADYRTAIATALQKGKFRSTKVVFRPAD
jgi:L-iditol 2-dehydrogenase